MTNVTNLTTNKTDTATETELHPVITQEALAHLGDGQIAYVRPVRSEDVKSLFPQIPEMADGIALFALHAADGTPMMLTDSREAALANAWSHSLQPMSVH
jgi:hypothetical protein